MRNMKRFNWKYDRQWVDKNEVQEKDRERMMKKMTRIESTPKISCRLTYLLTFNTCNRRVFRASNSRKYGQFSRFISLTIKMDI